MKFNNKEITILLTTHCYLEGNQSSIWVLPGLDDDADDAPHYSETEGAINLVGPIQSKDAYCLYFNLIKLFENCGFTVANTNSLSII